MPRLLTSALLACLILGLCLSAGVASAQKAVARINNEAISEDTFRQALVDWFGKTTLEEMIMAQVVAQGAANAKVTVTDQDVEARVVAKKQELDAMAQAGVGPSFEQWMARNQLNLANVRFHLRTELLLEGLVQGRVQVTPEAVSDFYTRNAKRWVEPAAVKMSVIALKTAESAQTVRASILSSQKSWGDASRESNVNPYTMKDAGDLGYCTAGSSPLADAAFKLTHDGDVTDPLAYNGLFYLVRREDRRSERTIPFEEVRERIEATLHDQQLDRLKEETRAELMKQAHIERLMEFPETPVQALPTAPPATP
jgi:foldase protein PrsA